MRRPKGIIQVGVLSGVLWSVLFQGEGSGWSVPLSDLAQEQFEKGPAALSGAPRSPFVPGYRAGEELDLANLAVQGVIHGKGLRMALLSGRIVSESESVGPYRIGKIEPDRVELSLDLNRYILRVENYVAPVARSRSPEKAFTVEFRNASLREALRFLAKGAGRNIIMPEDLGGRVTLSFEDVELTEAIRSILRVNGLESAVEADVIRVGKPDAFAGGTDLRTQSFHLKYATAKDLTDKIKPLLSEKGAVVADDRTNTLTVKDRDPIVATIGTLVAQIDRRDQQVRIEARIVDASRNFSRNLGIRWGITAQKDNVKISGTADVGKNVDTTNPLNVNLGAAGATSGIGMVIGKLAGVINIESQLTAAEQKGDVNILSKPSVTTLNNMPAKIRSGTKIFVKSTSNISVGTPGGTGAGAAPSGLQEINTGIELTVTPQISLDQYIKMKIDAVESEADFSRTVDGIPSVIDNTASTTVILKDGETTVIGGLSRNKASRERRGVPGFQKIPGLGLLFQSRSKLNQESELLIFITPRISGS